MQAGSILKHCIDRPPELSVAGTQIADGRYIVRLAKTPAEIDAALKLRFEVFNLELGEGLQSSFQTGRDRDEFDAICHHLIAVEKDGGHVIGTYRLLTMEMAGSVDGFYAASEFEVSSLPRYVTDNAVELGRACIGRPYRNRQVLLLLWKGLASYLTRFHKRFTFGCCSLTSQDPREGVLTLAHLQRRGHMHHSFLVPVRMPFRCLADAERDQDTRVKIPKLFESYLSIGAKVVSQPAIDRRFGTIDFLVLLDTQSMQEKLRQLFFAPAPVSRR